MASIKIKKISSGFWESSFRSTSRKSRCPIRILYFLLRVQSAPVSNQDQYAGAYFSLYEYDLFYEVYERI